MDFRRISILLVDHDPHTVKDLCRRLEGKGYQVDLVGDLESGLVRIASAVLDCVILDEGASNRNGFAALTQIRDLPDPPPVIYLTATDQSAVAIAALKAGAADYVVKDDKEQFIDHLDEAIRSAVMTMASRRRNAQAERDIRKARDWFEALAAERQVLMREVNHRVGNSLQLVAAFLHMQATSSTPETRVALGEANRRVLAIAQVHRRLYSSDDVQIVALHHYLRGLVDDIRQSADAEETASQLTLDADEVEFDPDRAVTIGIVGTELVINALKYAYPDGPGPIHVVLRRTNDANCRLTVTDVGVGGSGPSASPRAGIGRTIIKAMASKLAATVTYDSDQDGTRVTMVFPILDPAGTASA